MSIESIIAGVLGREGGYVDNPSDRGGPTKYGITEAVAWANGWRGSMRELPQELALRIYRERYVLEPKFDQVRAWDEHIAEKLVDTGVNMGVVAAATFLQRALNALNLKGELFPDVPVDGHVGPQTISALKSYCVKRGGEGRIVLLKAMNSLQGARYIELAEAREKNEEFVYGWFRERVGI